MDDADLKWHERYREGRYYAAFYRGRGTVWDGVVRAATRSPYSHVELVRVLPGLIPEWISSSPRDGGVRVRAFRPKALHWDFVQLTPLQRNAAHNMWLTAHAMPGIIGAPYDWSGAFGAWAKRLSRALNSKQRWFCSELVGWMLKLDGYGHMTPQDVFDAVLGGGAQVLTPDGIDWR